MKHIQPSYAIKILLMIGISASYNAYGYTQDSSITQQAAQSPSQVAQRLIASIEHEGVFKDILEANLQQQLLEVLHRVAERAPRDDSDGCDVNGCGTGFAGPCGNSASADLQVIQQTLCCIKNTIGVPCGICCMDDACAELQTLFGLLACICSKIDAIGSISSLIVDLDSSLDTIESKLDACCTQLNSKLDVVDSTVDVIESKLDACCTQLNSKIDVVISTVDGIESSVDVIESKLDTCCGQLNSKLDIVESFVEVIDSKIDLLDACASVPLSQADLDAASGNLNPDCISGSTVYCLTEDVTSAIQLCSDDITLNLNGHVVNGSITISGLRGIVRNGKIIPQSVRRGFRLPPTAAVMVNNSAFQAHLSDLIIDCSEFIEADDADGLNGLQIDALMTLVENCTIIAGPSGTATSGVTTAMGGTGVIVTSTGVQITNCIIHGGNGALSGDPTITTGSGGTGLMYSGGADQPLSNDGIIITFCTISGGDGGILTLSGADIGASASVPIVLGNGGFGIYNQGVLCQINNCTVTAGNGTSITDGGNVGTANRAVINLGIGGTGCYCTSPDSQTFIDVVALESNQSLFVGGRNGSILASGNIGVNGSLVSLGSGFPALSPIISDGILLNNGVAACQFNQCVAIGGSIGSSPLPAPFPPTGTIHTLESIGGGGIGFGGQVYIFSPGDGITALGVAALSLQNTTLIGGSINKVVLDAGSFIDQLLIANAGHGFRGFITDNTSFVNCTITSGSAADVEASVGNITAHTITGSGGDGINFIGANVGIGIQQCIVAAQPAGGSSGVTNASIGGTGGSGIVLATSGAPINNVSIVNTKVEANGAGGNNQIPSGSGIGTGTGGNAGNGIVINGATNIQIEGCLIVPVLATGGEGATGGNGGAGISITQGYNVTLQNTTITGTGFGGATSDAGTTGGDGGDGIDIINSSKIQVLDCTITNLGSGGEGGATPSATGGNGGTGISVTGTSNTVVIRGVTIASTGEAGNSATPVNGGDGVFLQSFVATIDVDNCSISNTGLGSDGGSQGLAINDLAALALIYSNKAYSTGGYVINGTNADGGSAGTPFGVAAGTNYLVNITAP